MKRNILLVFLLCFCCGCSWFFKTKTLAPAAKQKDRVDFSVEIIDTDALLKGALVFVEPFKAGGDAEASLVLDHISTTIAQGSKDGIESSNSWGISSREDADFILRGYVEKFKTPGKFRRMLPGQKQASLRVRGELRDRRTGAVIALVYGWKKMKYAAQDIDDACYHAGRDIITGMMRK